MVHFSDLLVLPKAMTLFRRRKMTLNEPAFLTPTKIDRDENSMAASLVVNRREGWPVWKSRWKGSRGVMVPSTATVNKYFFCRRRQRGGGVVISWWLPLSASQPGAFSSGASSSPQQWSPVEMENRGTSHDTKESLNRTNWLMACLEKTTETDNYMSQVTQREHWIFTFHHYFHFKSSLETTFQSCLLVFIKARRITASLWSPIVMQGIIIACPKQYAF